MKKMIWRAVVLLSVAACGNGRNHKEPYENGLDRILEDTGMYRRDDTDAAKQVDAVARNAADTGIQDTVHQNQQTK